MHPHPHVELIESFYSAFAAGDASAMAACYHPEVHFSDEVFDLHGDEAGAMWAMLCERGKDLRIDYRDVQADDGAGGAHWEATYTFSATSRRVHNSIDARFEFRDGRIVRHVDSFDFWKWSRQALGLPGFLLGWSGFLRAKVARIASRNLEQFAAKRTAGPANSGRSVARLDDLGSIQFGDHQCRDAAGHQKRQQQRDPESIDLPRGH